MAVHRLLNEHKRKHDLDSLVYRLLPHLHRTEGRKFRLGWKNPCVAETRTTPNAQLLLSSHADQKRKME